MADGRIPVHKQALLIEPDERRVITRPFLIKNEVRVQNLVDRVMSLSENEVAALMQHLVSDYAQRHRTIEPVFLRHYQDIESHVPGNEEISHERKVLLGAYFTMEYAVESAALFNPSIVLHPNQEGLKEAETRVILSLRAVGEGHVSSLEFRSGVLKADGSVIMDPLSRFTVAPKLYPDRLYDRHLFRLKLLTMNDQDPWPEDVPERQPAENVFAAVLSQLSDHFTLQQLRDQIHHYLQGLDLEHDRHIETLMERMIVLALSNYSIDFPPDSDISERVIFPVSSSEVGGIEDARFVRFQEPDGNCCYLATYTAFDRHNILTQVIETEDFCHFRVHTLNGNYSQSKGMAFFPRRVNGKYAIISRVDGENLYLMYSDNLHFWDKADFLCGPTYPWEFTQIGNCGSPIETEEGWLLITHGVGPMRRYCIGAMLLDLDDPSQVKGILPEPLIEPDESEREGYVPNVVYSCGALAHNGWLVLPYAVSDTATRIATLRLDDLLSALVESPHLSFAGVSSTNII